LSTSAMKSGGNTARRLLPFLVSSITVARSVFETFIEARKAATHMLQVQKLGTYLGHIQLPRELKSPQIEATSDAGGGTRTPDTRIMIRASPEAMRFLRRWTFPPMLSVLPELRSSVHRPVHRRRLVASGSGAEDDSDRWRRFGRFLTEGAMQSYGACKLGAGH
jgi:hypothetical protein